MKKQLLLLVLMLLPMCAWAQEEPTYFTSTTEEGVEVSYYVLSSESSYCVIGGKANGWGMPTNAINTATQGSLTIPETVQYNYRTLGVVRIDMNAFNGCNRLTSVSLPDNMAGIGMSAFENCNNLASIKLPKKTIDGYYWSPENDFFIGSDAFRNCYKLTNIELPEGLKELLMNTFASCFKLNTVTLPSTLTKIESSAFGGCESLTSVSIKASVPPTLDATTFDDVSGIRLYVPKGSKIAYSAAPIWGNFKEIVEDASLSIINFADDKVKALCVANWDTNGDGELDEEEAAAVTDLGDVFNWRPDVNEAPYDIQSFNELRFFTGLTAIGEAAFNSCTYLASLTLPNTIKEIGEGAFYGCRNLTSITIPDGVTSIGDRAFCECNRLASITIPASVSIIYGNPFVACTKLSSITVADDNPNYDSREGCNAIIRTSSNTLISGCKTSVIPNTVKAIGYGAFNKCTELSSVIIPSAVTTIGDEAFYLCANLESLTITNGVQSIGARAFYGCKKINSLTIPASVTNIREAAFQGCSGLNTIVVASGNTNYDSRGDCNAIIQTENNTLILGSQNTVFPTDITSIGNNAFGSLANITTAVIPEGVTSIGAWAFNNCPDLTSIVIPSTVTLIGQAAFYGCNNLKLVKSRVNNPFSIAEMVFQYYNSTTMKTEFTSAKLQVPYGCKSAYEATDYWNKFSVIEEQVRCAKPTISLVGGKLHFECETEGVEFHYEFTTPASGNGIGNDVSISSTYVVNVYASKTDYADSEVATANIDVTGIKGDVTGDGEVTITDAVEVVNIIMGK